MRRLFFLMFLFSMAVPLFAQVDGRLTGSVVDTDGKEIPGAGVALTLRDSKIPVLATITTSDGLFSVPGIPPGYYDLSITAAGFQTYTLRAIKVDPARETTLPTIVLSVQPLTITVNVIA